MPPTHVPAHLVSGVKSAAFRKACREAEGHGGVVGPLAGLQAEWPAAHHVVDGPEAAGRLELQRRAQGIARGQPQKGAAIPVAGRWCCRQACGSLQLRT